MDTSNKTLVSEAFFKAPHLDPLLKNFIAPNSSIYMPLQPSWDNPSSFCFDAESEQLFTDSQPIPTPPYFDPFNPKSDAGVSEEQSATDESARYVENWDPTLLLNNLSVLEEKIHQLQDAVHTISSQKNHTLSTTTIAHQQPLIADLTFIITEVILTADTLLLSSKNFVPGDNSSIDQLDNQIGSTGDAPPKDESLFIMKSDCLDSVDENETCMMEQNCADVMDTFPSGEGDELKGIDDALAGERLLMDSYEILQLEKDEILAPHAHFCSICGKGFKRDANLRMHMRGHGDEYKTVAALSKPNKDSMPVIIRRYSCPFVGCKRNKEHKNFQPLKTILCVKNHYKRSHCDKSFTCSRCKSKRFSVIADLKTHEKHCGRDKWICSCGTTFSRKDKLVGHVALFQGHSPILPVDEIKCCVAPQQRSFDEVTTCNNGPMEFFYEIQ